MRKDKRVTRKVKLFEKYSLLILIATLFFGVVFADIADIELTIDGEISVTAQNGIYITDVEKVTSSGVTSEEIKYFDGTTMSNSVTLSSSSAYITYKISIYNNTLETYYFAGPTYVDSAYSNKNITFELSGITPGITTIDSGKGLTFNITFKNKISSSQTLNSMINFKFSNEFGKVNVDGIDYTTPKGITWEQFIGSGYNTYGFKINNGKIYEPSGAIVLDENSKLVAITDIMSEEIVYKKEEIRLTLSRTTGSTIAQGDTARYTMTVTTNGTIKTSNVTAQILTSNNSQIGTATVSGSGTSYTISIDTFSLTIGTTYKIKIPKGAFVTENGILSEETISSQVFSVKSSGSGSGTGGDTGGNTTGENTVWGNTVVGNTL